jgi:hypothetical protein
MEEPLSEPELELPREIMVKIEDLTMVGKVYL